ncbi:MAG: hypothetical protein HY360_19920 [Verrucomicrobia bacterium]|nr:hypothetical protein [Verrucomicrobiota bacterium]
MKSFASAARSFSISTWKSPPAEFRPIPFWVWNDRQEPAELRRQIREMRAQGFGGFFIHSRLGLRTPYLGSEWFRHVKLSVEEAARTGLKAWIYDEDRWPSGFAGGKIAEVPNLDYAGHALACRENDGQPVFAVVRSAPNAWCNGASWPDMLNPKVVSAFLRLTHAQYRKAVGNHFGRTVPGAFTDEPSFIVWDDPNRLQTVPWTKDIEALFKTKRGYALRPRLASLFFDKGNYRRVRIDFYRTITERFVESFAKQINDWCAPRRLITTGHMMEEDTLIAQVRAIGAAMPHYEYFQQPGIDHLGYDLPDTPLLPKQCVSVAHQLGRERVLSELFGACGWDTTIGTLKRSGDWDFALGINVLNQHLAYYSIRGCRKRDYPSSCSYHQPGYPLYKSFNDYFARLSYVLTRGRAVRRILVLHPIASAWALFSPRAPQRVTRLDARFGEFCRQLLEIQRDYDYGDELLLEKYGKIMDGEFVVGKARYRAVVVPSAETWSAHTLALLEKFAAQGGKIISVAPVAGYLDGRPSKALTNFLTGPPVTHLRRTHAAALDRVLASVPRDVHVTRPDGSMVKELVYQHRSCGDREIYFLSFGKSEKAFRACISLDGNGSVDLLDAETGAVTPVPCASKDGCTRFELDVPRHGSKLISLNRGQKSVAPKISIRERTKPLSGSWKIRRLNPNVLALDRVRVKFWESPWTPPMGILGGGPGPISLPNANDLIAKALDSGSILPQWPVFLRFEFHAVLPSAGNLQAWFVLEDPQAMTELQCNGSALRVLDGQWWLDRQFRKCKLGHALRAGRNAIECRVRWIKPTIDGTSRFTMDGTELENGYVIGDFNVVFPRGARAPRIVPAAPLPDDPSADLARAGLPFYSGVIRYERRLNLSKMEASRRCILRFSRPHGEGIRLSVNNRFVRDLWYEPFEADCTDYFRAGGNLIQADLFANLGNLLGLLHHKRPWSDAAHSTNKYLLRPFGLGAAPALVIR